MGLERKNIHLKNELYIYVCTRMCVCLCVRADVLDDKLFTNKWFLILMHLHQYDINPDTSN